MGEERDWAVLVLLCLATLLAGLLELFYVSLYVGGLILPVTIPVAVATTWYAPRIGHTLVRRTAGAALVRLGEGLQGCPVPCGS